jgi:catechol 2,3-dioxygenase-like lactoylglutathione lyase family enzyme
MQQRTRQAERQRPVEKYKLGLHHLAQPTLDPAATLDFYVDTMGATITHCISSRGWRESHFDYIHMFLEIDAPDELVRHPDNIAMFYYFGAKTPAEWPKYGTHHSFAAESIAELDEWESWLTSKGHEIVWRAEYEVMTSIYVWDPNGRFLEIAAQHRPLNEIDADDGRLTAQALVLAAGEQAESITRMWGHKARLIEERDGAIDAPVALICPRVEEFGPIVEAAVAAGSARLDRGSFTILSTRGKLEIERPQVISEALWWGVGTGGVKGAISTFDERRLIIG